MGGGVEGVEGGGGGGGVGWRGGGGGGGGGVEGWSVGRTVPHRTVSPQYRAIHTATYRSKAVPHRTDIKQP